MLKRFIVRYVQVCFCIVLALSSTGCAARYSTENLRRLAPAAELVDVCTRIPTVESDTVVVAHNSQTGASVSDRDWDAFERAAETADVIYRYDPNAPEESASRLPWPYHKMSCQTVSSSEKVPLPKGMRKISISDGMREALVAALLVHQPMRGSPTAWVSAPDKRFLGQLTTLGYGPRAYGPEAIDEVGQMLRDTLRNGAPTVSNGAGGEISIFDTTTGQVIGGLGAGAFIGTAPGGALIAAKLQASPDLPQPTRQFSFGQALGEMGSGTIQFILGSGGTVGGVSLSVTGGGSILGVPTCIAGVALAANGAATFLHGAHTLVVTICHWEDLPSANAAQQAPPNAPAPAPAGPPAPAPIAAAPPPKLTAPTAPTKTTTKTVHKGPNGEIVKTVTKTGENVTTTLPKQTASKQPTGQTSGPGKPAPSTAKPSPSDAWRVGDDIYKPTAKGEAPNWSTVRARYWKNEAAKSDAAKVHGAENVERMKRGLAPQRYNEQKGGKESKDLSHEPTPAREGGTNVVDRWPQDHAKVDSHRRPGY